MRSGNGKLICEDKWKFSGLFKNDYTSGIGALTLEGILIKYVRSLDKKGHKGHKITSIANIGVNNEIL